MLRHDFSDRMPKNYNLNIISCTHFGNVAISMPAIRRFIKTVKEDKNAYWAHLGDTTESIHPGDTRYDPAVHAGKFRTADEQAARFAETFSPIANKCLFVLRGNHEEKIVKTVEVDKIIVENFEDKYGIDKGKIIYGGRTIKAILSEDFRLYATHGSGSVNSRAGDRRQILNNDAIRVKRKLRHLQSDCIVMVMGHIHKVRICAPVKQLHIVGDKRSEAVYPTMAKTPEGVIPEDFRWYCSSGTFLRTLIDGVTTYSEAAMYPPTEIGYIRIIVEQGRVQDVEKVVV
ncbi:MAG: metallophosphoesterase [Elusimicrobiota bacterium]